MYERSKYTPPIIEKFIVETEKGLAVSSANPIISVPVINEEEGTGTTVWFTDDF